MVEGTPLTTKTTIVVRYPRGKGGMALRGNTEPLSWTENLEPAHLEGDQHTFEITTEAGLIEFKPFREGVGYSCGRDYAVQAGSTAIVVPYFERSTCYGEAAPRTLFSPQLDRAVTYEVFLPPSYGELPEKRYPVLYAQDGQSLFSTSHDPFDGSSWRMDDSLNELYDLAAIEEILVVAVRTDEGRLEMLSPTADAELGGGQGPRYLEFLIDVLKPTIDATYRTLPGRAHTGLIGASMGGLFSFFAAWTRPEVFGKSACLSASFWWDNRAMVRMVEGGSCPYPRPLLYLDSGASKSQFERDANLRDGYHHTLAMRHALVSHCYVPGENVYTLAFAGMSHDNASWAARLAVPLQMMFPVKGPRLVDQAPTP